MASVTCATAWSPGRLGVLPGRAPWGTVTRARDAAPGSPITQHTHRLPECTGRSSWSTPSAWPPPAHALQQQSRLPRASQPHAATRSGEVMRPASTPTGRATINTRPERPDTMAVAGGAGGGPSTTIYKNVDYKMGGRQQRFAETGTPFDITASAAAVRPGEHTRARDGDLDDTAFSLLPGKPRGQRPGEWRPRPRGARWGRCARRTSPVCVERLAADAAPPRRRAGLRRAPGHRGRPVPSFVSLRMPRGRGFTRGSRDVLVAVAHTCFAVDTCS